MVPGGNKIAGVFTGSLGEIEAGGKLCLLMKTEEDEDI